MANTLEGLEVRRKLATSELHRGHRSTYGQFFTPAAIADYMAALLDFFQSSEISLLDPGAGIGTLTAAAAHRAGTRKIKATCYEIEPSFQDGLTETLESLTNVFATVEHSDFIAHAVKSIGTGHKPSYTHAILNPPYKKINTDSVHRLLVRKLGVETSNLYTCFLACTIALCGPGAQVIAIVPRSFMNGLYFKPFRYWLLGRVAITHIHLFDSRNQAFFDDDVLQENVILRLVVDAPQGDVEVTTSYGPTFADISRRTSPFTEVVTPEDEEKFIHVPSVGSAPSNGLPGFTLNEIGLDVCTGPVVDFRMRDDLRMQPEAGTAPLLYASHFVNGRMEWPRQTRKPNAIAQNRRTERWLMPNGCYVILRRFSSKEEKRRVVAYVVEKGVLPGDVVGFENHLNVIHQNKQGLPETVARGLADYLNSQEVDNYFRTFSGHTQVNATDLRRLRYPALDELKERGKESVAEESSRGATDSH